MAVHNPPTVTAAPVDNRGEVSLLDLARRGLRLAGPDVRSRLRLMAPLGIGLAALEMAALALLLPFVDTVVTGDPPGRVLSAWASLFGVAGGGQTLLLCGVSLAVLLLSKSIGSMAFSWWQYGVLTSAEARMATTMVGRYLDASVVYHSRHNTAEAIRNVNASVNGLHRQVLIPVVTVAVECVGVVAIVAVLAVSDPLVVLVLGVACAVLATGFLVAVARPARWLGIQSYALHREAIRQAQEGISGIKIIQVSNRQESMIARFAELRARWRPVRHRASFLGAVSRYYLEIALVVGVGALVVLLASLRSEREALSGLGVTLVAAFLMLPAVGRVLGQLSSIRLGQVAVDQLEMALAELEADRLRDADEPDRPAATSAPPGSGFERSIRLDRVVVTHDDGRQALAGLDLDVARGETIGIVGRSGAGKTTLVDVLLGLVRPTAGSLLIDDRPLGDSDWSWWRSQIGYVSQDAFTLDDSVLANVTLAEPVDSVDRAAVDDALRRAQLHDVVAQLPHGIETRLGERGMRLSGGQRQRLGLARALYRRPRILVLDEATSALDLTTELEVQKVLAELSDELTIVVVAHRLSTVRICDRIVVLEGGRVESVGTFDGLRSSSALFAELMTLETPPSASSGIVVGS